MIPKKVIIDTGPIVAFLNASDQYHVWAITQFSRLSAPFYTCDAVIAETCHILRHYKQGVQNVLSMIDRELIQIPFRLESEISNISTLMKKYHDIPMSLADACLVRMSEQISNSVICTLDSDFRIYRKEKRAVIPLIIPATGKNNPE